MIEWLEGLKGGAPQVIGACTGAAIGLIALMLGALFNAHLNRRRDDELRRLDTRATAASLRAELSSMEETVTVNAGDLDNTKEDFYLPDLSHSVRILPSVLPKMGLFDADTIKEVIEAYIVVEQYGENLIVLGGKLSTEIPNHRRIIFMPMVRAKTIAKMNRELAERVTKAKQALNRYLT
jgi:hypothetical protein